MDSLTDRNINNTIYHKKMITLVHPAFVIDVEGAQQSTIFILIKGHCDVAKCYGKMQRSIITISRLSTRGDLLRNIHLITIKL